MYMLSQAVCYWNDHFVNHCDAISHQCECFCGSKQRAASKLQLNSWRVRHENISTFVPVQSFLVQPITETTFPGDSVLGHLLWCVQRNAIFCCSRWVHAFSKCQCRWHCKQGDCRFSHLLTIDHSARTARSLLASSTSFFYIASGGCWTQQASCAIQSARWRTRAALDFRKRFQGSPAYCSNCSCHQTIT